MKKTVYLVLGLILANVAQMKSDNLFVYGTDGSKRSYNVNDVRNIQLTDEALVVNLYSDNSVSTEYSTLHLFSLKNYNFSGQTELDEVKKPDVNVFPNPVIDEVTITNAQDICFVSVCDLQGRQLLRIARDGEKVKFSMSTFPAGVYLVYITSEKDIAVKKIIKK
jgi:hypothetical protein